ncbi:MAG: RNA methyltransferase [Saprospiraceae bacterium]|nr:RNA methyltransferase [Saprospiraceae bacterium]
MLSKERIDRLTLAISKRQWDLTVVLENVHDPHNLGAVLRSCEAIGITEIFVIYTEETPNATRYVGRNASSGVSKWIKTHFFYDLDACMRSVKSSYGKVFTTHLGEGAKSLYELDLTVPAALMFGNEKFGLSKEALSYADHNFVIPIQGMAESLNVSVACSVSVFEAMRQRQKAGMYDRVFDEQDPLMAHAWQDYLEKARPRIYEKDARLLNEKINEVRSNKKAGQ